MCVCVHARVSNSVALDSWWPHCSPPVSAVCAVLQARILEWVAIPFSRRSSRTRDWTQVSCFAGEFFIVWAMSLQLLFFPTLKTTITLICDLKFLLCSKYWIISGSQLWVNLPPEGHFLMFGDIFCYHNYRERVDSGGSLVGRGQGYSWCTGWPTPKKNFLVQMSSGPTLSNAD